jgi:quinol monooxygenase YgiN
MSVVVVATITPVEGKLEELAAVFAAAIPKVHAEPGCELYALHRKGDSTLVMIEKWASADDLKAHSTGATMAEIGAGLAGLVDGRTDLLMLTAIPAGDPAKGAL